MTTSSTQATPSRNEVWRMFDRIAHRYDLLNRLLSFGRDVAWRKVVAQRLPGSGPLRVLDLATGTGDLLFAMVDEGRVGVGRGLDLSEQMLQHGQAKLEERGLSESLTMDVGDATDLKEPDSTYDAVTIGFGIRNVVDVDAALSEMMRVLKPGGRVLILESSIPENAFMRAGFLFYFRHILPLIGGLISGDSSAYRYLNQTTETFAYGDAFVALMVKAGFVDASVRPLTFGVASLYEATRRGVASE